MNLPESPADWCQLISETVGLHQGTYRCGAASDVLAKVLSLQGFSAAIVRGEANGIGHVWVEVDGIVYDPTVGQFSGDVAYSAFPTP
ncbi:hypothetical protein [Agrobacterium sp. FDAARGOS_525]|uniref:hypothetical protein n=1 Tax=Agrobacterium sp. FDAARGOS_525 TaxID=2420311 RepID=UPI000F687368|nr:hypothetical protein [Agrobacterium sp. FDAARGOS_525]